MRPPPAIARWLLPILASLLAATGCRLLGSAAVVHDPFQDEPVTVGSREAPARRTIPLEVIFVRWMSPWATSPASIPPARGGFCNCFPADAANW